MIIILERFLDLLYAPLRHPSMVWIVVPLLIALTLMTIYFAKYKNEELGWNTALGNSLVLIFVSLNLFQHVYVVGIQVATIILSSILLLLGIMLLFVNFTHYLPKRISYFISSPLPVNLIAYVAIAIVYSEVIVNVYTLAAGIFLLASLLTFFLGFGFPKRGLTFYFCKQ
ncbi:hypothetical protein HOA92_00745 [archaeon]|jgi:hypothetical protein|nr:hypothetical protein [archaeon]MBT6761545.1 hypothetical protein [archaeon]